MAAATTPWGLQDQLVFPEVDYARVDKIRGMNITVVTTAKTGQGRARAAEALGHAPARLDRDEGGELATTAWEAKVRRKPKFKVRHRNRCRRCGRPRGYIRKFELCRNLFPAVGPPGRGSRRGEGELVGGTMGVSTDPIADMLTSIRNAVRVRHPKVDVPLSRVKTEIARVLKEEGFVAAYKVIEEKKRKSLRLYLKYSPQKQGVITGLRRISRSGRRVYRGPQRAQAGVRRDGHQHCHHAARRHDRAGCPARGRGRGSALRGVVGSYVAHRTQTN